MNGNLGVFIDYYLASKSKKYAKVFGNFYNPSFGPGFRLR